MPADAAIPFQAEIAAHLGREEGRVPSAYQDSLGYWTIGVGRLIDASRGGRLSEAEIDFLLANDIRACIADLQGSAMLQPAWARCHDNAARVVALVSMRFQLGRSGLEGFAMMLQCLARGDFAGAAAQALDSRWARQTPARARRIARMLARGEIDQGAA